MEVVRVPTNITVTGVGAVSEILNSQTSTGPSFPTQHALASCIQDRPDNDEDDFAMDTDQDADETVNSPQLERPMEDDDSRFEMDHMDYEDNPTYQEELSQQINSRSHSSPVMSSGRRNKRKNFQPRNIVYFAESEDQDDLDINGPSSPEAPHDNEEMSSRNAPLDLSEPGVRLSFGREKSQEMNPQLQALLNRSSSDLAIAVQTQDNPLLKEVAEQTMRRLLGIYGINDVSQNITPAIPNSTFFSGKLLETLNTSDGINSPAGENSNSDISVNGTGEPSTPPRSPQLDGMSIEQEGSARSLKSMDSIAQQQAINSRIINERNFATLLTLAALQEGKNTTGGIQLPPTLDHSKGHPTTPTTPTSRAVTPGIAGLSLGNTLGAPSMVSGNLGMRDSLSKPNVDYSRYVKRYSSAMECGNSGCREINHREHFHCLNCDSKVFSKKEEMIRHFKWHKKRDESLQHGFMRYSSTDDCSDRFSDCSHNRKQTHYHCLKESCDKVYISTSDVQMHANYHRKDSAILQEGFQRFRASEDCLQPVCPFSGQRTTHFHCMRSPCNYTFKNKADMEKHKTYHAKDEQLTKDGFKKFMKQEDCCYDGCKLSKISNHIHCIRPDCNYVLHSSGQIFAHKRKHERQDHEKVYRKYKLAQSMIGIPENHPAFSPLLHDALKPLGGFSPSMIGSFAPPDMRMEDSSSPLPLLDNGISNLSSCISQPGASPFLMGNYPSSMVDNQHPLARLLVNPPPAAHNIFTSNASSCTSTSTPISSSSNPTSPVDLSVPINNNEDNEWSKYMRYYDRNDTCHNDCELNSVEHWHCDECESLFHVKENAQDHGRSHEHQNIITDEHFTKITNGDSSGCPPGCHIQDHESHYHCNWENCEETYLLSDDKPFRRLEHYKIHEFARRLPTGAISASTSPAITSIEAMFKRKRGRPPKNRIIEVWNDYLPVSSIHDSPQATFTSFKLPKTSPPPHIALPPTTLHPNSLLGLPPHVALTPLGQLAHMGRRDLIPPPSPPNINNIGFPHLMPTRQTTMPSMIPINEPISSNPSQTQVELVDGFYLWEAGTLCSDQMCPHLLQRHYHCSHPRCIFVTTSHDILSSHTHEFHENFQIPEGFLAIDRNVNCRLISCQSNQLSQHFHCIKCKLSLANYEEIEAHMKKHDDKDSEISPIYLHKQRPDSPVEEQLNNSGNSSITSADTPSKSQLIKAAGTFYPLSPFPLSSQGLVRADSSSEPGALITAIPTIRPPPQTTFTLPVSGCLTITATRRSPLPPPMFSPTPHETMDHEECGNQIPLKKEPRDTKLNISPQENNIFLHKKLKVEEESPENLYETDISCSQPFCKLKKKEHIHCHLCNQAFSEQEKLKPHIMKHLVGYNPKLSSEINPEDDELPSKISVSDPEEVHSEIKNEFPPFSPHSIISSINNNIPSALPIFANSAPRLSLGSIGGPQPPHFPSHLIYSQTAGFPGLPSPFAPHFAMSGIFPNSVPRLLPPGTWAGVHPALAAMAHPQLMLPQIRSNGDLPTDSSPNHCNISPLSSVIGGAPSIMPSNSDQNSILANPLNSSQHLGLLGKRLGPEDFSVQNSKKIRGLHSLRLLKDEPVPEGYIRFRFNEDCQYSHCTYRNHQTHFHCMRNDCGYSFCDKTRFVQHTARHERLDTLMGDEFQQFRSNVPCGRADCAYSSVIGQQQNKASHFHCLKCEFVCTDTNKVVAHRRQHLKKDSINAAGFEKFTPSQPCNVQNCSSNQKATHYHCLLCQYAVNGLSQMSAHKYRHLE